MASAAPAEVAAAAAVVVVAQGAAMPARSNALTGKNNTNPYMISFST
jgi:hypothetical protein